VRVNGHDVTTATQDQAIALLRGRVGTRVRLGIQRGGVHGIFTVLVTRGLISVPDVSARMIGTIAYVRLTQFGANAGSALSSALRRLLARHPRGLVLDLRDDPGGYVSSALDVNSQFLPPGRVILWEQNSRHQLDAPLRALGGGVALRVPMAVLVNDGTASAAEITAGALQDYHRATIIGITTYGKGSVQQEYTLPDGSSLRVTIRLWLTPRRHLIQNRGITPDIYQDSPVSDGSGRDAQLARALRLLQTGR
jgi:carboxyl-terminal processing protease